MKMKRVSLLTISWFIGLASLAHGDLQGPSLGIITDTDSGPKYSLTFNHGIEHWENGKRSDKFNELWNLNCIFPYMVSKKPTTWCLLERTTLWPYSHNSVYPIVHMYSSAEGTLKVIHAYWKKGELDFSFGTPVDKITTEVKIRMEFVDHGLDTIGIYLRSFQAFAMDIMPFAGFTIIEKRIPQYTYTLNVPVEMRGFRSKDDKKWDDLLSALSLSQQDQEAWENFETDGFIKCSLLVKRNAHTRDLIRETIIPDWKKRKVELQKGGELTADEKSLLKEYVLGQVSECLVSSNISLEGQKKILEPIYAKYFLGIGVMDWLLRTNFGTNKDAKKP